MLKVDDGKKQSKNKTQFSTCGGGGGGLSFDPRKVEPRRGFKYVFHSALGNKVSRFASGTIKFKRFI
jgi:hypothetical protein